MDRFICAATPVRDEAYCLDRYLDNVTQLFDGAVAVIDDRTVDESQDILERHRVHVSSVVFEDFGQIGNELLKKCRELGYQYALILNPDEMILPNVFIEVMEYIKQKPEAELFLMARRNWYDLDMRDERAEVFPDWQCKIVKLSNPNIRYVGAVHESITGFKQAYRLPDYLTTEHFNLYYYKTGDQDYNKKIEQYNRLAQ